MAKLSVKATNKAPEKAPAILENDDVLPTPPAVVGATEAVAEEKEPEEKEKDYVIIYSEDCLKCLHLCPTLGVKAYKDCHFSKGNEDCPAKTLRVAIGVNVERTAKIYTKYFKTNNVDKLTRMNKRLSTKDPAIVAQVMALVQQLIRES